MDIVRLYKRAKKKIKLFCKGELEVDLILSAGDACRAAFYLQKHRLRDFSSPLDWMMCYTLKDMRALIENNFKDFFKDNEELYINGDMRVVKDRQNGMISMHAFPANVSIKEYYPEFKQAIQRRAQRLIEKIKNSKNIAFLCTRTESITEFKDFLRFMYAFHPANYTLINVRHNESLKVVAKKSFKINHLIKLEPANKRERERDKAAPQCA